MLVAVFNLATGDTKVYTCTQEQAVIAAYEQEQGNYNTWEYPTPEEHPEFVRGKHTIACGNWATRIGEYL